MLDPFYRVPLSGLSAGSLLNAPVRQSLGELRSSARVVLRQPMLRIPWCESRTRLQHRARGLGPI